MTAQELIFTYVDESKSDLDEKRKRELIALLCRFWGANAEIDFTNLSRQTLIQMFATSGTMSMSAFDSIKSRVCGFTKWLCKKGICSESILTDMQSIYFFDIDRTEFYDSNYFKDFSELYTILQKVFCSPNSEFDTFKSAAMLVWFGIEIKDLPSVLKSDLHEDAGYIVHPISKRKIYLPENAIKQLASYKCAETFLSPKFGGSVVAYAESQYLFRTYKNSSMTAAQLTNLSSAANRSAEGTGKVFQWNRIYLSGLYKRLLDYENQFGEIGKLDDKRLRDFFGDALTGQSPRKAGLSQKYKEYQAYKEYMYRSARL